MCVVVGVVVIVAGVDVVCDNRGCVGRGCVIIVFSGSRSCCDYSIFGSIPVGDASLGSSPLSVSFVSSRRCDTSSVRVVLKNYK